MTKTYSQPGRRSRVGPRTPEDAPGPAPVMTYYLTPEEIDQVTKEADMATKRIYFSRTQIQDAVDSTNSINEARKLLGTSTGTFYRFMREYGIKAKNKHGYYRKEDAKVENTEQVENVIEMEEVKIPAETEEVTAEQQQVVSWQGPKPDEAIINDDEVIVNLVEPDPIPKRGVYEGVAMITLCDSCAKAIPPLCDWINKGDLAGREYKSRTVSANTAKNSKLTTITKCDRYKSGQLPPLGWWDK